MPDVSSSSPRALPPPVFHILIALADGDRHGYAIMQDLASRTGGELKMSPGTLYGSIKRMLEEGFIREIEDRPAEGDDERRRYYRITPAGRDAAAAEMKRIAALLAQARATSLRTQQG
jgi:DNA-binding PadR family transcriptional regulator